MTEQTNREKILQRVLNLRARAENDGSSEAEMQTAFSMAAKLMDSYNIEEAELALAESEGRITLDIVTQQSDTSALKGKQRHKIIMCLTGINALTQTKCVYNSYNGAITFTGHRPDVALANYLVAVVREALDREYDIYRNNNVSVGHGAKASFQTAMAIRVNSRLYEMARENEKQRDENKREAQKLQIENASTASSTALVISEIAEQKRKEVSEAYRKAHPSVRSAPSFSYGSNRTAHSAGSSAGDRVNLGRSISATSTRSLAA